MYPRLQVLAALLPFAFAAGGRPACAHPGLDSLRNAAAAEVAQHPDDPGAHLRQGEVHRLAGEWEAALVAIAHAAEHGGDPDAIGAARGRVLLEAGRPRLAKREFDRVLARRPDGYRVLFERGRAWQRLGYPERAARDYGRAIAGMGRPTPDDVFEHRDALLAAGRIADAVRALDQGIARLGPAPSLELAAVDLEAGLGRHDDALMRIDTLLAQSPRNAAWVIRRGELLQEAGRPDEARTAFATALALLEARPRQRRGKQINAMEDRLRAALAPTATPTEGKP